jgi:hypothetical protein
VSWPISRHPVTLDAKARSASSSSGASCNPAARPSVRPSVRAASAATDASGRPPPRAAAGRHYAYPGRPVLDQERERLVHLQRADHVVVSLGRDT